MDGGKYEFLRVPFGLSNSPSVFQRFIYTVFRKLIRDNVLILYMSDLLIPSQNEAEGLNKLRVVLQTATDFGLELNLKKCNFLQRTIEFLGYMIENGTIKPSLSKTQAAVQSFPQPQTSRKLQSFIGLTNYFRKFIPNYALISRLLSNLLRDNVKFKFGPTEIASFQELKSILSEYPVLHVFQQDKGSAFTSTEFQNFCQDESIEHIQITTGGTRGNGQIKRLHETIIPVLTKLTIEEPEKWFKHIHRLQRYMNSTTTRSKTFTPFEVLIGEENKKQYNKRRKLAYNYKPVDTAAIQRTEYGTELKLRPKYFGPYEVTKVNKHDRYEEQKIGQNKGLNVTSTSADKNEEVVYTLRSYHHQSYLF
ncbi:retrovirus-related Pol polyprotein from transposon 297, partial [Trichonephila clavipes]